MWWVLSGMGGDPRLYDTVKFPTDVTHVRWDDFVDCDTIPELAERIIELGIQDGDVIVGTSLGGMVALEIARRVRIDKVVLLGSCVHPREINQFFLSFSVFAKSFPWKLFQKLIRILIIIPVPRRRIFRMFVDTDVEFFKRMCYAPKYWQGYEDYPGRMYRMHGRFDPLILRRRHVDYDLLVNATHLLAIESPKQTSAFLAQISKD